MLDVVLEESRFLECERKHQVPYVTHITGTLRVPFSTVGGKITW